MAKAADSNTMPEFPPLVAGERYGQLTAVNPLPRRWRERWPHWVFRCDCGVTIECAPHAAQSGRRKSCGCSGRRRDGAPRSDRTLRKTSGEFRSWSNMIGRCYLPRHSDYRNYGAKGVTVCDRWRNSFDAFVADMGPRPSPRHSIDRFPNHAGNYEPTNCRWATPRQQARNYSGNTFVEFRGRRMCLVEAAELTGLKRDLVYTRLARGWPLERALTEPPRPHHRTKKGRAPSA